MEIQQLHSVGLVEMLSMHNIGEKLLENTLLNDIQVSYVENPSTAKSKNVVKQIRMAKVETQGFQYGPIVYTIKDVAELLQCSESSVNNLRERGILREVKGLPGVRFNKKEVEALVGIVDEYSPLQYRKLEKERDELLQENEKLKMSIRKITSDLLVIVEGELKL